MIKDQTIRLIRNTGIITALFALVFISATFITLPKEGPPGTVTASKMAKFFTERLPQEVTPLGILLNNFRIMLLTLMIHPIGLATALISAFTTGFSFSVLGTVNGVLGTHVALLAMSKPFFWFEIVAYCFAAAQSIELGRVLASGGSVAGLSYFVSPSKWGTLKIVERESMSRLAYLLLVTLHIDVTKIDKTALKKQLLVASVILIIGTILLTIGAVLEVDAIKHTHPK